MPRFDYSDADKTSCASSYFGVTQSGIDAGSINR